MEPKPVVVVVDNHPEIREVLSGVLEALSFTTCQAADVPTALQEIDRPGVRAVVTDVEMSPQNGFELLATCREKHPELPVIMVSSYANPRMRRKAMAAGAAEFLSKPFTMMELHDALERCTGDIMV